MAPSGAEPPLTEILYDNCSKDALASNEKYKKTYTQEALLALCTSPSLMHIQDAKQLMPLVQDLSSSGLFIVLKTKSGVCWSLRPKDAAQKLRHLEQTERTVYSLIEEAHEAGIWIRTLKAKIGIKDGKAMDKMLANLCRLGLVQNVTNIKSTGKKYYMLAHLVPSQEITGGSFYDAGDLDEGLIEELGNLIVFHVRQMSWVEEKRRRVKRETSSSPIMIRDDDLPATTTVEAEDGGSPRKKRKRDPGPSSSARDIEDSAGPPRKQHRSSARRHSHSQHHDASAGHGGEGSIIQLPFSAGHEYPTAASVHEYITSNNILRGDKASHLSVDEVQSVVNVLVWDGKLEQVNGGYRSVRGVKYKQPGEDEDEEGMLMGSGRRGGPGGGLMEMPCGTCPVYDVCGNGGMVSAETCVYFERWLGVGGGGGVEVG